MKSQKLLESFTAYCKAHPDERFWQALRNWSGFPFIYGSKKRADEAEWIDLVDTFYIE